jgi:hypothetical protein
VCLRGRTPSIAPNAAEQGEAIKSMASTMVNMTSTMVTLTWVVAALTLVNVIVVSRPTGL